MGNIERRSAESDKKRKRLKECIDHIIEYSINSLSDKEIEMILLSLGADEISGTEHKTVGNTSDLQLDDPITTHEFRELVQAARVRAYEVIDSEGLCGKHRYKALRKTLMSIWKDVKIISGVGQDGRINDINRCDFDIVIMYARKWKPSVDQKKWIFREE